ncbi:high-affinity lysophosphatidic acid receptor-like isoform X2 [Amphiura filiformis]|uniref:high-affinity lysophosphatidic acid receptor-like isoform X2 n=1 Tax=Amphiura filiformis TaxID=82378 RepID=UPI003B21DC91
MTTIEPKMLVTLTMGQNITEVTITQNPYTIPYWETPVVIILTVILAIITVASIVGNCMVIIVVFYFRGMHTKTNMFIVNLAVADFGVAVLCMPFSLLTVVNGNWVFGHTMCNVNAFFIALFLIASIHGLMYISLHKYFSIVKPLARLITQRRAVLMIVASWTAAFAGAIGPVVGWTRNEYKPATAQCGPKFPENLQEKSHAMFLLTVGYLIPLIVLFYNYTVIFVTIRKYSVRLKKHSNYDEVRILKQQKQITITLFIVFIAFFICWTPYFIFAGAGTVIGFDHLPRWPNILVYWCGYASSAINPIIYAFRTKSYRRAFIKLCCCFRDGGLGSDSSPNALRRLNASTLSDTSRMRSPSMNSTFMNSSPSLNSRHLISRSSVDPAIINTNSTFCAEIVVNPLTSVNLNGRSYDHNSNHGNLEGDDVFDERETLPREKLNKETKKRSVSESDKEGLEERHYGPTRKHSDLTVCLSTPLEARAETRI